LTDFSDFSGFSGLSVLRSVGAPEVAADADFDLALPGALAATVPASLPAATSPAAPFFAFAGGRAWGRAVTASPSFATVGAWSLTSLAGEAFFLAVMEVLGWVL